MGEGFKVQLKRTGSAQTQRMMFSIRAVEMVWVTWNMRGEGGSSGSVWLFFSSCHLLHSVKKPE